MRQILELSVNWMKDWSNDPQIEASLSGGCGLDESLRYREHKGHYFATDGLTASIFGYEKPGEGYGGRAFPITMEDGTEKVLKGPWSSSATGSNATGQFPEIVSVHAYLMDSTYKDRLRFSTYILASVLVEAWAEFGPADVELLKAGPLWFPHPKEGCIRDLKKHSETYACPKCNRDRHWTRNMGQGSWEFGISDDQAGVVLR